jgi:hypothetical protein
MAGPAARSGCGEAFRAHVVSYADDFVCLSRGHAAEALAWTKAVMTKLGLTINEAKTSLKDARKERFDFLDNKFFLCIENLHSFPPCAHRKFERQRHLMRLCKKAPIWSCRRSVSDITFTRTHASDVRR